MEESLLGRILRVWSIGEVLVRGEGGQDDRMIGCRHGCHHDSVYDLLWVWEVSMKGAESLANLGGLGVRISGCAQSALVLDSMELA